MVCIYVSCIFLFSISSAVEGTNVSGVIPREFYTSYSDLTVLVKAANHHGSATSTMAAFNTGDISESVRDDSSLYIPNSFRGTDMTLSVSVSLSHCLTDSLLCSFSPPTLTLSPTLSLSPAFSLALSFTLPLCPLFPIHSSTRKATHP